MQQRTQAGNAAAHARVYVTAADTASAFSSTPFYFARALQQALPHDFRVLPLPMRRTRQLVWAALAWGARRRVDPRPYFFLSRQYQDSNLASSGVRIADGETLIAFSQVLPTRGRSLSPLALVLSYIDLTLSQYFEYQQFKDMPAGIKADLVREERRSYEEADFLFVFSEAVARELRAGYGVDDARIEVIGRGTNLPAQLPRSKANARRRDAGVFRIGFIGLDFERKGLLELIAALAGLEADLPRGTKVRVIGPDPHTLPRSDLLEPVGYIDKTRDLETFCAAVADCDLGCLYSKAEGIPGSCLEFIALGVPCLISDADGLRTLQSLPGIIPVPLAGGVPALRTALSELIGNPLRLNQVRAALGRAKISGWEGPAERVSRLIVREHTNTRPSPSMEDSR
jgi:glycosyltransferase involved in cell wall biosynthesis